MAFNANGFSATSASEISTNGSSEPGFGPFAHGDGGFFTLARVQALTFTALHTHRVQTPSLFSLTKASTISSKIANSAPVSRRSETSKHTSINLSTMHPLQNSSTALRYFTALQSAFINCSVRQT
jgi:hypothetical protein